MNKNFNNFVESQLHVNEEDFNIIINNLPSTIRNNEDLDFSEYDSEFGAYIEKYLLNQYILNEFGLAVDDIEVSSKAIWIFTYTKPSLEDLNMVARLLEDWTIENFEELVESAKSE